MRLVPLAIILTLAGCPAPEPSRAQVLSCARADGSGFSKEARFWKVGASQGYWFSPDVVYRQALTESCSVTTLHKGRSL